MPPIEKVEQLFQNPIASQVGVTINPACRAHATALAPNANMAMIRFHHVWAAWSHGESAK
jgi:hypothetical protein